MAQPELRCVKNVRCPVTVGELYRWILAKLSDKDIKRALHKYRDLMPRQSDWNRKLTQATNVPELGFRYLFRCGQIDESNHRTMQKMLKYIDRQDVLPYFDTILYNTNMANSSLEQLKDALSDSVLEFLLLCDSSEFNQAQIGEPYAIVQCQQHKQNARMTRSVQKRLSTGDYSSCLTFVKKCKLDTDHEETAQRTPSIYDLNEIKFNRELQNEAFSNKILTILRQARQRHRNTPFISHYTITGVLETPVQMLLRSKAFVDKAEVAELTKLYHEAMSQRNAEFDSLNANNLKQKFSNPNYNHLAAIAMSQPSTSNSTNSSSSHSSGKKKCETVPLFFYVKLKIIIRVDVLEDLTHITSNRSDAVDRKMHIFRQSYAHMRNHNRTGEEVVCEVRCTTVEQVDLLWSDYLSGRLKRHLKEMADMRTDSSSPFHVHQQMREMYIHNQLYGQELLVIDPAYHGPHIGRTYYPISPSTGDISTGSSSSSIHSIDRGNTAATQTNNTNNTPPEPNKTTEFHVFINKHEYESCRNVLMRNLYPMSFYLNYTNNTNILRAQTTNTVKNNRMNNGANNMNTTATLATANAVNSVTGNLTASASDTSAATASSQLSATLPLHSSIPNNSSSGSSTMRTSAPSPAQTQDSFRFVVNTNATPTISTSLTNSRNLNSVTTTVPLPVSSTNTLIHHRFSAVQQLMARLRDVSPQFAVPQQQPQPSSIAPNNWPSTQNVVSSSSMFSPSLPTNNTLVNQIVTTLPNQEQHINTTTQTPRSINTATSTPTQISIANRPVLMHMFYPHESLISYTVNPVLSPIQVVNGNTSTHNIGPPINSVFNTPNHANIGSDTNISDTANMDTNTSNTNSESLI